ncbi:trypsin-like serine protease [Actinoplanes sp. M2I2]|uniref:S1 family peptidase n=1 Tax=Actinoplanes sp. M2I2 TaxID=1734444 RepID=UPI0020214190|nr:trypsin-like serine protease [Actinoplanes sp. M2I2]
MQTLSRVLVAVVAILSTGAVSTPAHAIANGEGVPDGTYEFAVKLIDIGIPTADGGKRNSSCSGGLISPHWVLTAGHCFKDENDRRVSRTVADKTIATVGRADLKGKAGVSVNVVEVRQHGTADVALARLDKAVTGVTPLRLNRKKPADGQRLRLVGFGLTRGTAKRTADRLQTGQFEVTSVSKSELGIEGVAPRKTTSACPHDSGGPYFTGGNPPVVVAVVSRGPTCPHSGADTSTRVDAVAPWILSVVGADLKATAKPKPAKTRPAAQPQAASAPRPADDEPVSPLLWVAAIPLVLLVGALLVWAAKPRRGSHRRR